MRNSKARKAVERKRKLTNRRRRIAYRLRERNWSEQTEPMFIADCRFVNPQSTILTSNHSCHFSGIGAMHLLARRVGLIEGIDDQLHLLKRHLPYHESDHVLNVA